MFRLTPIQTDNLLLILVLAAERYKRSEHRYSRQRRHDKAAAMCARAAECVELHNLIVAQRLQ
jgi:hypothetical protein